MLSLIPAGWSKLAYSLFLLLGTKGWEANHARQLVFPNCVNPIVSIKISGSNILSVTMYYGKPLRCKSCLQASVTDRSIITIRQKEREL